ncbi:MAG: lamin tail domain-containing protein, partial [Limisphaerales bacterium]
LARPSYGEGDVRAWASSTYAGGSPGDVDPVTNAPDQHVLINEFLAHTDDPELDFVELYNHSNASIDISGYWLSDDRDELKFQIPAGTIIPARGYVAFDQDVLGFSLDAGGETILLVHSDQARVVDAVKFGGQENGVSSGRWPDAASTVRRLSSVTRAASNSRWRWSEVVINEVMYSPISGDDDDEFVELHNTTGQSISLAGWKFTDGPEFTFPSGASIPANGYVVIARNAAQMRANHPQLNTANTFGDYSGSLRNSSENIELAKPDQIVSTNVFGMPQTNTIFITVSKVRYRDGGRWPAWADGGGSSLELVDPRSDTTQPDNWRESNETAKGQWSTVVFTGILDNGNGGFPANQLQITLQGAGECLVDQVEVLKGGVNYVTANGNFESGTTGWVFQGNHSGATVNVGGAFEGTRSLHIRAPGRGDTGLNRIRTALNAGLNSGDTVTIRARVRWLQGWPEILLRLRGNWLECAGAMSVPQNLGTPGQVNSRFAANTPPAIYEVKHSPILPAANQSVTVTARVSDPDAVTALALRFRVDPSATVSTVTMRDDGLSGDLVAGDGVFSGLITGRAGGTLVAFRIDATDASGTRSFPVDAPARECLVRWEETLPFGTIGSYRVWMKSQIANEWSAADGKDNTYRDMTFVYNADRVIYNATIKDKGSPFHGGGGDAFVVTPEDEPFLGATDMALCSTGNAGNEETAQREQIALWIGRKIGAHYLNRRFVNFFYNGSRFNGRNVMEDAEEPNGVYSRFAVPDADDGDLYKIEDWFEFNDDASSFSNVDATLQRFTSGGSYKLARYRWTWRKRAVSDSANNYTNLFDLVTAVNTVGASYVSQVENLVNVRNWMATFALQRIAGNWDSYGFSRGKNAYLYKGDGL